jgi:hypothetical protein
MREGETRDRKLVGFTKVFEDLRGGTRVAAENKRIKRMGHFENPQSRHLHSGEIWGQMRFQIGLFLE